MVGINVHYVHHSPEYWDDPERFDPMRFTPDKLRDRHKYAWVPFGGGAHMCLGLHFAHMQVTILLSQLLKRYTIEIAPGYEPAWQPWPTPNSSDERRVGKERVSTYRTRWWPSTYTTQSTNLNTVKLTNTITKQQ